MSDVRPGKKAVESWKKADGKSHENADKTPDEKKLYTEQNQLIQQEIPAKIQSFNVETARLCGFYSLHLEDDSGEASFRNGKPILKSWFIEHIDDIEEDLFAVFSNNNDFCGLIEKKDKKHFSYRFVLAFSR